MNPTILLASFYPQPALDVSGVIGRRSVTSSPALGSRHGSLLWDLESPGNTISIMRRARNASQMRGDRTLDFRSEFPFSAVYTRAGCKNACWNPP